MTAKLTVLAAEGEPDPTVRTAWGEPALLAGEDRRVAKAHGEEENLTVPGQRLPDGLAERPGKRFGRGMLSLIDDADLGPGRRNPFHEPELAILSPPPALHARRR